MKLKTPYKVGLLVVALAATTYAALVAARIIEYAQGGIHAAGLQKALVNAARKNDTIAMRVTLALGADPNARDEQTGVLPLTVAAREGLTRPAKLLLSLGAYPDGAETIFENPIPPPGSSIIFSLDRPLFIAATRRDVEMINLLRTKNARYELVDAIYIGDDLATREMLSSDQEAIERFEKVRDMALRIAVMNRDVGAVERFLVNGADPYDAPLPGTSAWDFATDQELTEALELMNQLAPRGKASQEREAND